MSVLDPLDPELRDLLAREGDAYSEDTSARDAILRRIHTAVMLAPLATGAALAATSAKAAGAGAAAGAAATAKANVALGLGWKGAALITVVAFGGGIAVGEGHRRWSEPAVMAPPPAQRSEITAPSAPATTAMAPAIAVSNLPVPTPPETSSSPAYRPTAPSGISDTNEERALVERARTALARGLASDALAATDQHTKRFPRGRLAEEREALAVQALALSGDKKAAEARAGRFRRSFPNSIFASAVDRAVSDSEKRDAFP